MPERRTRGNRDPIIGFRSWYGAENLLRFRDDQQAITAWDERGHRQSLTYRQLRQQVARVHRWLGLATWAAVTATVVLGYVQYRDEYGFFADEGETPCARGDAIVPSACDGTPWPHAALALTAGLLYAATATASVLMPEAPEDARHPRLGLHEALRWIHMGGMIALPILGAITSNLVDDFGVRQGLATWHMIGGTLTWAALTAAGALVL